MAGHEDKARHYISLMNTARVDGKWNELPELIRKVTKHAPNRHLLIETATAEHEIIVHTTSKKGVSAPGQSPSTLDSLERSVEQAENVTSEEMCQAKACLAWAAWTSVITKESALTPMQAIDTRTEFDRYGKQETTVWTKICLIKIAYIQGRSLLQRNDQSAAYTILDHGVIWIELNQDLVGSTPQLAYWCEQLLATRAVSADQKASASDATLKAFRLWSILSKRGPDISPNVYGNTTSAHIVRVTVWKGYYSSLSKALQTSQKDTVTGPSYANVTRDLRAVESAYETELLRTQKFPKASDSNKIIEAWVEQAVRNWYLLCGSDRRDADLGEGGRNAVTRNMLDILYRAASKTFQSTLILRRLFQVHRSLTEFDLAYRCLDTYVELIERGRARSAKSQDPDSNQDSDEIVLLTMSEGVFGLCGFGQKAEARKAYTLSKKLESRLTELSSSGVINESHKNYTGAVERTETHISTPLSPQALEIVHRAVGIAKANWARWTPFSETRTELQSDALASLQKACEVAEPQMESLYAYGLLLAETREVDLAIQTVKRALGRKTESQHQTRAFALERGLLPFWHLMALLLSARDEFETASRSCTAAFEQFSSASIFSRREHEGSRDPPPEKAATYNPEVLVDDMECDELQRMIEIQMSNVALAELMDGPELALKGSNELLILYSRLFARFDVSVEKGQQTQQLYNLKSSTGTAKSFRESIFSRRKVVPSSLAASSNAPPENMTRPATSATTRPNTLASATPAIHVTDETERPASERRHMFRRSNDESFSGPKRHMTKKLVRNQSKSRGSEASSREPVVNGSVPVHNTSGAGDELARQSLQLSLNGTADAQIAEKHDNDSRSKQQLEEISHNVDSHRQIPPPAGHVKQPPEQDVRLPTVNPQTSATAPVPRFPQAAGQKHALMLLNKIWLLIATLYRRGHVFEDAREACDEASKIASRIETLVTSSNPTAKALADPGWGGVGKSSDEIWADVYCERAELALAVIHRRADDGQEPTSNDYGEAVDHFEQCLMYFPNHAGAIVGLSNLLLDYYEKKIDLSRRTDDGRQDRRQRHRPRLQRADSFPDGVNGSLTPGHEFPTHSHVAAMAEEDLRKTPENLNRIAARDRAYGLLSTLTRLGTGWDDSEAWYALARAHELGGEIEKAKGILWWCIELEDTRPIRHWRNLGSNGYVLS